MSNASPMRRPAKRSRPLEYTLLYAATLLLLAIGAVMVYSASSATSLLRGPGDPSYYLKPYVLFGPLGGIAKPLLIVVGCACALLMAEPDMGTAMVVCFATGALLIAAGVPKQHLLKILAVLALLAFVFAMVEPYRRDRLLSFLHPWA